MRLRFHAQMFNEMKPSVARRGRHPVLCSIWSVLLWVLCPLAYFGLLMAPFVLVGTVFKAIHNLELTGRQYWAVAGPVFLVVVWYLRRLARRIWHFQRQSVVDADGIVALIAVALAVATCLWLFPPR